MDVALEKLPVETFPQPQINTAGLKPILRGQYINTELLTQALSQTEEGTPIDISQIYGNIHNILHFVNRSDPTGPFPSNPASDGAYTNWEYGVQNWNKETFGLLMESTNPTASTTVETEEVEVEESNDEDED